MRPRLQLALRGLHCHGHPSVGIGFAGVRYVLVLHLQCLHCIRGRDARRLARLWRHHHRQVGHGCDERASQVEKVRSREVSGMTHGTLMSAVFGYGAWKDMWKMQVDMSKNASLTQLCKLDVGTQTSFGNGHPTGRRQSSKHSMAPCLPPISRRCCLRTGNQRSSEPHAEERCISRS